MRKRDHFQAMILSSLFAFGTMLLFTPAASQQQGEKLMDGPGADIVQAKCTLCHDLGNITRIRQSREGWEDTIKVMVRRGAPLTPDEATVIVNYLTTHYGR